MKKWIAVAMSTVLALALSACGSGAGAGKSGETTTAQAQPAQTASEWTREGYFLDDKENMLTVTYTEEVDEPGWYVSFMPGQEGFWGGTLAQEGNTLHGTLPSEDDKDDLVVTVSEEGEDGVILEVEGGETYHLKAMELEKASIFVTINTEGMGNIEYTEGEKAPEINKEYPSQSAQINLAEPATHTFLAWPEDGYHFVKWTKDGEDFSTDAQITVLLDESADYVAVFEEN